MLLGYALTDDQLMKVTEKFEVLYFDDNYIGEELTWLCRNAILNPERLKYKK